MAQQHGRAEHAKGPSMSATPPITRQTVFRPFQLPKTTAVPAPPPQPGARQFVAASGVPGQQRPQPQTAYRAPKIVITSQKIPDMPYFKASLPVEDIPQFVTAANPFIVELGAHHGEDTQKFLDVFPGSTVHAFECDFRALTSFQASVADPRCTLHPVAVSDYDGSRVFHQSGGTPKSQPNGPSWDHSGSILAPKQHLIAHPWCTFDSKAVVPCLSLDTWLAVWGDAVPDVIAFAWCDIQSAEYLAVKGGTEFFKRVQYFYFEANAGGEMYESEPLPDVIMEMLGPNFEAIGVYQDCNILAVNRNLVPR